MAIFCAELRIFENHASDVALRSVQYTLNSNFGEQQLAPIAHNLARGSKVAPKSRFCDLYKLRTAPVLSLFYESFKIHAGIRG